jgi:hypothetical protein
MKYDEVARLPDMTSPGGKKTHIESRQTNVG